jgi:hypothetical protein
LRNWTLLFAIAIAFSSSVLPGSAGDRVPVSALTDPGLVWRMERSPRSTATLPGPGSPLRTPAVPRERTLLVDGSFLPSVLPSGEGSAVEQVIVTTDALASSFEVLAERETRRGIPTVVRTLPWIDANFRGIDTPSRIRAFLREAYDRWGTEWVLLGGDVEDVPTRWVPWDFEDLPVDAYYACLDREWNEDGDGRFAEPLTGVSYPDAFNDVTTAPDGTVWVGGYRGVSALGPDGAEGWDERHGLPNSLVHDVDVAPDGSVWVATESGLALFEGDEWTPMTGPGGPGASSLSVVLAVSATEAWTGGSQGLSHYDSGVWTTWSVADGIPTLPVVGLAREGDAIWMATVAGAARWDAGTITPYTTANSGLLTNWVLSVSLDEDGRVWFGHADTYFSQGGLSCLDGGIWTTDDFPLWNGLSIRSMIHGPAPGELWAATGKGVLHRTTGGDVLLGLAAGLPSSDCFAVTFAPAGIGVATADGVSLGDVGAWTVYGSDDLDLSSSPGYDDADLVPELIVGRLPVSTPQELAIYLTKLEDYQDGKHVDHVGKALFLGENLFEPGDGKAFAQNARDLFPPTFDLTELYEVDGTQNLSSVVAALNDGPGIVVNVSHGSYDAIGVGAGAELLFNRDIRASDAGGRSAFFVIYSCNSGAFDLESSGETFLLHPGGGAIAVMANTREAVPDRDSEINEDMFAGLFASTHGQPARVLRDVFRTRVLADPEGYRGASWARRTFLSRSFLGLPTLSVWRGNPGSLDVAHPATVPFQRSPFAVHVSEVGSALPVEGARVCLSLGTSDYAYGDTDASGDVTFDFRPDVLGDVRVVVTSPDHLPYEAMVPVTTALGPNPVAAGWQPAPGRIGLADDEREILLSVRNAGLASAAGWDTELSCDDPEITVLEGLATLPPLTSGETVWVGPFRIRIDPTMQDGQSFVVRLEGSGEVAFRESFALEADAARLRLEGLDLVGSAIFPRVTNLGAAPTGALTATLTTLGPGGTVNDGAAAHGSLAPGATATFADGFDVSGAVDAPFELTIIDAQGRTLVRRIDREAPDPVFGLVSEARWTGAFLTWGASTDSDLDGYLVESEDGKGGWINEFDGLVGQGAMADMIFDDGTSRLFRVTAVDESGWHSSPRMIDAHAAPAEFPGWPRRIPSIIGPSPIVLRDLDSDDSPEVLLGSMWETNSVHVFRVDGSEWTDGDARPETDGVFGVTAGRIHAAPLAVDVDGDGNREIFAASLDGSVYAWRTDGPPGPPEALPGWPVLHTDKGVRSSPVAADVDGDGQAEIVTVAIDGLVRALGVDGTMVPGWPYATAAFATGSTPAVMDLNGDGKDDVVFGGTDNLLRAVSGDGTDLPGWPQDLEHKILCSPVLADVDGDAEPEIFCQTRAGRVVAYHVDGTVVDGWPVFVGVYAYTPPSPAVADFDQDGVPEIVVGARRELFVLRADGGVFPGFPLEFGADVINSPVVADLDGDGCLDIVIGTADRRLHALSVQGQPLNGWPLTFHERPWSTPFVMDVDGDGDLDLALAADDQFVHLLDLPGRDVPGATPWPGYHGGADLNGVYDSPMLPTSPGLFPEPVAAFLTLRAAAPNPFRQGTDLGFSLPRASVVRLDVYDVAGRRVARPVDGLHLPAGAHRVAWDGRNGQGAPVASGVYFLRLEAAGETRQGRVVRLR